MKNIMTIALALLALSCKSQTISLEEAVQCQSNPNCPTYTYAKDINNSLNKYIGSWKGIYNGKTYEMKFNKSLYEDFTGFKRDEITGRIRITTTGNMPITIFDNYNEPDDNKTDFSGLNFQTDLQAYRVHFAGSSPSGCINSGTIYLRINSSTPNQMTIYYLSDQDIVVGECPSSFSQTFPEKKNIILTKQ